MSAIKTAASRFNSPVRVGLAALALTAGCATAPSLAQDAPEFAADPARTALLITDPQNDFLSEDGALWSFVAENVAATGLIDNIDALFAAAQDGDMAVFVSPHMYFPHDDHWSHRGPLQSAIHDAGALAVSSNVAFEGFEGSGADFYEPYDQYIFDGETVIVSPHKIYGPESNDLVLQLRLRGVDTVIVGGFAANLCTEGHMRELVENGFTVVMVSDAVGATGEDAYQAALLNYSMIADAVWTTEEAVAWIRADS